MELIFQPSDARELSLALSIQYNLIIIRSTLAYIMDITFSFLLLVQSTPSHN